MIFVGMHWEGTLQLDHTYHGRGTCNFCGDGIGRQRCGDATGSTASTWILDNISTNSNWSVWNIRNVWGLATPKFQHIEKRKVKFKGNPPTLHITKCLSDFIHNMSQPWHENMRESAPTCVSTSERKETLIGPRPGRLCQNVPWIAWIASWRFLSKCFMMFWLVVLTILNNMKVNGKDYPIYYGKSKMFDFETTNQSCFINCCLKTHCSIDAIFQNRFQSAVHPTILLLSSPACCADPRNVAEVATETRFE